MNDNEYTLYNDDCLARLDQLEIESIDCIVTDPPYELNFMEKGWDNAGVSFQPKTWEKCLQVLKPGGYLLAFGGSRTFHRIACAIEDAGFEIRDTIMWLYGSGFPKSMNVGLAIDKKLGVDNRTGQTLKGAGNNNTFAMNSGVKPNSQLNHEYQQRDAQNEWKGWGTTLKPSFEPIIMARKPFKGSLIDNVLKNRVGGLNIDECRTENDRFPANTMVDSQNGEEWRRYFYCAKASRADRDEGLDSFDLKQKYYCDGRGNSLEIFGSTDGGRKPIRNIHPTVKPTNLMRYLLRLVAPKGSTVLDPFMGSGSTGKAAMYENKERNAAYKFIGIEKDPEYCKIAEARIKAAKEAK